jgi:hypothetical protein
MSHRNRLARRPGSESHWIGRPAGRGIPGKPPGVRDQTGSAVAGLLGALQVELVSLGVCQHHPASW